MYFIIGNKGIRIENYVLYFGLFAVLMGAWSLNETVLMALLVKNTVAGSNLGYILIMLMPAPFAMFVQGFLMPEDKWAAGSITFLSVLNMAACVLLHMTGILEFRNSVTFTHILMAMDILYLGYALVHYVKKHGMDRIAKTNIVGIIILFAAFAADIIFFYVISTVVDILGRTGFLVYICLLAWLAASDSMEKLHEGQAFMTTSCCPSYIQLVEKHIPDLKKYVSTTGSPMYYTARMVKEQRPGAKIVFVGPCVAKRKEVKMDPCVDYTLTFEEVASIFTGMGINLDVVKPYSLLSTASREAYGFAQTGGVVNAVKVCLQQDSVSAIQIAGLNKKNVSLLRAYAKTGKVPAQFVEVMACEGGCVTGPSVYGDKSVGQKQLLKELAKITSAK